MAWLRLSTTIKAEYGLIDLPRDQQIPRDQLLYVDVDGWKIANVHKPSTLQLISTAIVMLAYLCLHAGDFNC